MPQETEHKTSSITIRAPMRSSPVASLYFTHGSLAGKEVPLAKDTFFIGRSRNNNITLPETSVSRKHAVINFLDDKYIISDLDSLKGTFVNGKRVKEEVLNVGDVINIGQSRMEFRRGSYWPGRGRRRAVWYVILVLIIGALVGTATWFFAGRYHEDRIQESIITRIEAHYSRGVELFNKERDVEGARAEWSKILELDPEMKTGYAANASILLKNTEKEQEQGPQEPKQPQQTP